MEEEKRNAGFQPQTRPMTYGERAVGITFNPGGDQKVNDVKKLYAQIIDILREIVEVEPRYTEHEVLSERGDLLQFAIREAQGAQMWAVKGITFKN